MLTYTDETLKTRDGEKIGGWGAGCVFTTDCIGSMHMYRVTGRTNMWGF